VTAASVIAYNVQLSHQNSDKMSSQGEHRLADQMIESMAPVQTI